MKRLMAAGIIGGFIGACMATAAPALANRLGALGGGRLSLWRERGGAFLDAAEIPNGPGTSLCMYGDKNKARLCAGTYPENGLPFVALGDNPRVQALLRLAGRNESGVLVFKDKGNHDRMILGLAMDDPNEEPFLVTFDKHGTKKVIFGQY